MSIRTVILSFSLPIPIVMKMESLPANCFTAKMLPNCFPSIRLLSPTKRAAVHRNPYNSHTFLPCSKAVCFVVKQLTKPPQVTQLWSPLVMPAKCTQKQRVVISSSCSLAGEMQSIRGWGRAQRQYKSDMKPKLQHRRLVTIISHAKEKLNTSWVGADSSGI